MVHLLWMVPIRSWLKDRVYCEAPGDGEGFGSCSDERCDTERLCAEQTLGWSRQ